MATIVNQLKKEIESRRAELEKLEAALEALEGGSGVTASGRKRITRGPRTPEQKAAQSERMKKIWAAKKKAGKPSAKKAAKKSVPKKSVPKKKAAKKSAPVAAGGQDIGG
jgi:hypothetical protein